MGKKRLTKPDKLSRQRDRTAKSIKRRREEHQKRHPNDVTGDNHLVWNPRTKKHDKVFKQGSLDGVKRYK